MEAPNRRVEAVAKTHISELDCVRRREVFEQGDTATSERGRRKEGRQRLENAARFE